MRSTSVLIVFLISIQIIGCMTVGPDFVPPEPQIPQAFGSELTGGLSATSAEKAALSEWWTTLDDPELNHLIERAVGGNLDLRQAAARIREARAQGGLSEAERFPTLDARGAVDRKRFRFGTSQDNVLAATTSLYQVGSMSRGRLICLAVFSVRLEPRLQNFKAA